MKDGSKASAAVRLAVGVALAIGFAQAAHAAIQTQTRTSAATVTPGGGWTNPNNAASINGSCALGDGTTSSSITMTDWSFAIPGGSTILGITVRSVASFNDISTEDQISLTKAGAAVGTAKTLNGPGASASISCGNPVPDANGLTVGGAADLWGTTWTLAEINVPGFGVFYDNSFLNNAIDGVEITVTYEDNLGPTVTINQAGGQADPTNGSPVLFTANFSASVTGFVGTDVSFAGSTVGGTLAASVSGGPQSYTVSVTGMTGQGTVVASIPAGVASDGANTNASSTSADNIVQFDSVAPTVTVNQAGGQADPTNASPINFTATFSETVVNLVNADISFTGSTAPGALTAVVSGGPQIYNIAVSGMTGPGDVVVSLAAGVANDAAGNGNVASTSTDNTVLFDNVAPTVTVEQAPGQADPTNAQPIVFTVTFSEPVTGFIGSDVSFAGSTAPGALSAAVGGGPAVYQVDVSGATGNGTIVVSIPANRAIDAATNANAASTSVDNTVTFDNVGPTVTIDQHPGQKDPVRSSQVLFRAVFDELVVGFTGADISFAGSTAGGALVAKVVGGPTVFDITVTGMTTPGLVVASIPAGVATDAATNPNGASTSIDNAVTWLGPELPIPALSLPGLALLVLLIGGLAVRARPGARVSP